MKLTRKQVIRALKRLDRGWPDDLWLFSANGTLVLMEKQDGQRVFESSKDGGGVDSRFVLDRFYGISNDGGDW